MSLTVEDMIRDFKRKHKYVHILKVDNLSVLRQFGLEHYESSIFEISGYKWKLVLMSWTKKYIVPGLWMVDADSLPANLVVKYDVEFYVLDQINFQEHRQTQYFRKKMKTPHIMWNSFEEFKIQSVYESDPLWGDSHNPDWRCFKNDSVIYAVEITNVQPSRPGNGSRRKIGTAECLKMIQPNPADNKFTWKITKFSELNKVRHFSHAFSFGQRKWAIELYPDGFGWEESYSMNVFLTALDYLDEKASKASTFAVFDLRVYDQLHGKHLERRDHHWYKGRGDKPRTSLSVFNEHLHDESKGFIVNDTIYIRVEFLAITNYCGDI